MLTSQKNIYTTAGIHWSCLLWQSLHNAAPDFCPFWDASHPVGTLLQHWKPLKSSLDPRQLDLVLFQGPNHIDRRIGITLQWVGIQRAPGHQLRRDRHVQQIGSKTKLGWQDAVVSMYLTNRPGKPSLGPFSSEISRVWSFLVVFCSLKVACVVSSKVWPSSFAITCTPCVSFSIQQMQLVWLRALWYLICFHRPL